MGEGCIVDPTGEHPRQLPTAFLALDLADPGKRTTVGGSFGDDDVRRGFGGYLRQVGDRQNLVAFPELPQLRSDRRRRLAPDPCVDLVEDVGSTRLDPLLGETYGEHDPAQLPARGVAPHRQFGLAGVRLYDELPPLFAVRSQVSFDEPRLESSPPQVEVAQVLLHLRREFLGRPSPPCRKSLA